MSTILPHMVWR